MACIFVGQLPFSKFFDADVYDLLEPYGRVLSVRMQHVKGEAFVYFDSVNSADAAIAALHGRRTLKGRQRPLQLFYASSSAEWSWFGIMHNTRLHHINHKVELPPFFVKTPPLAGSQWSLVPHITDEATELVLPATQQAMLAAEETELKSGEAKSTSSSLRTTTSSSSLYSDDSSAESARRPSRRRGGSASLPSTPSRGNVGGAAMGGVALRAGTKRPRPQLPRGEEEDEDEEARAAAQRVPTSAAMEEQSAERMHTQRTRSRRHGSGDEEARHRSRKTRSHRKTKLRIEDEENFAVLGDEEAEEEVECFGGALHTHCTEATTATRAVVGTRPSPASSSLASSATRTMPSGLSAEPPRATESGGGGGGGGGTAQDGSASHATAAAAPASSRRQPPTFLRAADAPFAELPSVLEQSATTTNTTNNTTTSTLSTTLSSAEDADVVGSRNVLIRRRSSARKAGMRLDAPNTAPAAAPSSSPAASAPRLGWGGMLPHHYHHVTHSSSTSLSPTPTEAITPNASLTNVPPSATAAAHAAAAFELHPSLTASPSSDQPPRRLSRVASPYHHHHHHHLRGAVLSNADPRDVRRNASRRAVLGAVEDAPHSVQQQSRGGSWMEVNEPVLTSPLSPPQQQQQQQQQQQPAQRGDSSAFAASIFPFEPPQLGEGRTWAGGSSAKKNSAPAEPSRGSGRGRDGRADW